MSLVSDYRGMATIFGRYWDHYGGWASLFNSPYLHFASLITLILAPYWLNQAWWDLAVAVLPSILGFSLAGYAIWLGFGDAKFRNLISEKPEAGGPSPYMQVSAAFAHFVVLQIGALLCAVIARATQFAIDPESFIGGIFHPYLGMLLPRALAPIGYGFGFLLFVYALVSALAAALAVFRVASWFDRSRDG